MGKRQQEDVAGKAGHEQRTYAIRRHYRHWEVLDPAGHLVCLTVYKRGAQEVVRRLCLLGQLSNQPLLDSVARAKRRRQGVHV